MYSRSLNRGVSSVGVKAWATAIASNLRYCFPDGSLVVRYCGILDRRGVKDADYLLASLPQVIVKGPDFTSRCSSMSSGGAG